MSQEPKVNLTVAHPALLSLLQGQANLIQPLTEKVNRPSEALEKQEDEIPPLLLKEFHKLFGVRNHPQWVTRTIYFLKCAILKEPLPVERMQMTHQWNDESQKPLLFALCEDQQKDETISTKIVAATRDTPMGGDPSTPPRPLEMNAAAIQMVEALWMLTYSSVYCYKNRYESDSTLSKQASSNPDFTSSLTLAGARLKKVMKKRFTVVDGVDFLRCIVESGSDSIHHQWDPAESTVFASALSSVHLLTKRSCQEGESTASSNSPIGSNPPTVSLAPDQAQKVDGWVGRNWSGVDPPMSLQPRLPHGIHCYLSSLVVGGGGGG